MSEDEYGTPDHKLVKKTRIVTSNALFDALAAHGLVPEPERTERIVIELKAGDVGRITYYHFADTRLLDALTESLEHVDVEDGSGE